MAGITRRIRIGTAVVVAPLYQPVRLAEEIALVDLVSHGRLELGIGSGYRFGEFRGLNICHEDSGPMFMEVLEILFKACTGEPFSQPYGEILFGAGRNRSQTHAPAEASSTVMVPCAQP